MEKSEKFEFCLKLIATALFLILIVIITLHLTSACDANESNISACKDTNETINNLTISNQICEESQGMAMLKQANSNQAETIKQLQKDSGNIGTFRIFMYVFAFIALVLAVWNYVLRRELNKKL